MENIARVKEASQESRTDRRKNDRGKLLVVD